MMKGRLLLIPCLVISIAASPCTTFLLHAGGQILFGRNYDWVTGSGLVCSNQRGLAKTSHPMPDGNTIQWVSRYGSITFNQYGKEFPTGGMNEKGLVVELMMLEGTRYPEADERPAVGALQWIQYQLDNCGTIGELIATDKKIRISSIGTTPIHFLVADSSGRAASIEFLDGKMTVHSGKELPCAVLTNDRYEVAVDRWKSALETEQGTKPRFAQHSIGRFLKAASMLSQYQRNPGQTEAVDYAFHILGEVAQGNHTKWSIVYDIRQRKIYFKTLEQAGLKFLELRAFDFQCSNPSKVLNINSPGKGDQADQFTVYSPEKNQALIDRSFDESPENLRMDKQRKKRFAAYAETISCKINR